MKLTITELNSRRTNFIRAMNDTFPDWDTALIVGKVNQYYLTGTVQDALLIIRKDGSFSYNIKRSLQRALDETPLSCVYPMRSYRDVAQREGRSLGNTYIEAELLPYSIVERLRNAFEIGTLGALDNVIKQVRAVKSPYELHYMQISGKMLDELLTNIVPQILKEGMSEADFTGALTCCMFELGYHGLTRFSRFQTEIGTGQIAFGTNSLYPTNFDGPGGARGNSAAVPAGGDPKRLLRVGDLVFVDIGFGINGYHSDKTQVYMFGAKPSPEAVRAHQLCLDVEKRAAELLRPGEVPAHIYESIVRTIPEDMKPFFMGYEGRTAKFLGHGIGLHVDEIPVIAGGFNTPLEENMVIALEPKAGVENVGMVGVEDTYIVTDRGGLCITGGGREIIEV
ncbi:MAG: aminopeptidase P family protein [Clostridiales bacterium]|nr:aminopeptidase P family protein [Clostridiales bacterium]